MDLVLLGKIHVGELCLTAAIASAKVFLSGLMPCKAPMVSSSLCFPLLSGVWTSMVFTHRGRNMD